MKRVAVTVVALAALLTVSLPAQQSATGLAADDTFLAEVRKNLLSSQLRQDRYAYKERRTELHLNPFGKIGTGATTVYDVVPSSDGETQTRRLIERDGKPIADGEVNRRSLRARQGRTSSRSFSDVVATLQFTVGGRDTLDGRPMVLVRFKARPNANPTTRQGRMARAFTGTIWIDERNKEVERVEATAVDSISMGMGLVARLNEGTKVSLSRQPVAEDIWLPTSIRFSGEGRALLFIRKVNVDYAIDWFDYRLVGGS